MTPALPETDEQWSRLHPFAILPVECLRFASRSTRENLIRQRARPLFLGSGRVQTKLLGRYKAFLDPADLGFAGHVMVDGYWEMWLTEFISRSIEPGMNVLDIGANFGYYSLLMADLIGSEGRAWLFEPNPNTASFLRASISLNGFSRRASIEQVALSSEPGPAAAFYVPENEPKNARLVAPGFKASSGTIIDVPITSVDAVVGDRRIDFVKIDAEGAEYDIFRGMSEVVRRWRPRMIIEFNAHRGDSRSFISLMIERYGRLRFLDFDGCLYDVDEQRLTTENVGHDWLIYLGDD